MANDRNWVQKSVKEMEKKGTVGALTRTAHQHGYKKAMPFAKKVVANPEDYSKLTRERAQWAVNVDKGRYAHGGKTQGYNAQLDESLGNRLGKESHYKQSLKSRRDESKAANRRVGKRAYASVGPMDQDGVYYKHGGKTQGYAAKQDESLGMRTGAERTKKQSMKARREDSYGKWGRRDIEDRKITMARGGKTQGYAAKEDESLGMRRGAEHTKSQSMKARREDSYGKWGKRDEERKKRLEEIRKSIRNENVSYGELSELESLKDHIDSGDMELRQWAGVPEDKEYAKGGTLSKKAVKEGYIRRDRYDKLKKDLKDQSADCRDDIKTMKKDIGKTVAKRIKQVEKESRTKADCAPKLKAAKKDCNTIMEGKDQEQNEALLLGGIAGIFFGAFYS